PTFIQSPHPSLHVSLPIYEHPAFRQQRLEGQHDAIADEASHLLAQYSRGDERQDRLAPADDECVAGVMPTLKARHGCGALREQVDRKSTRLNSSHGRSSYA